MAAVLITAWRHFHAKHPSARLTLGDLSQPWGGNLLHNVLVRSVGGAEALGLLNKAQLVGGKWVADEEVYASHFGAEIGRFNSPEDRVWIRHELTAQIETPEGPSLRTSTTRYTFPHLATQEERESAFGTFKAISKRGVRVTSSRVREVGPDGLTIQRWRDHWVDASKKRQMVTISRKKQSRRLRFKWVDEIRVANWQQRKPGSFPREQRWVRGNVSEDGSTPWTRWQAMREAGHVSHMGGSDADISFVTAGNARHFAVDMGVFDAKRTWAWFMALERAAKELGTSVEMILISRPIIRSLERHLSRKAKATPLWRAKVRRAGGHDAHHHLRLAAPTKDSETKARAVLQSVVAP